VLLGCRRNAVSAPVAAINQPRALIVSAPDGLRAELRGMATTTQITCCGGLGDRPARSLEHRMTIRVLRITAQPIQQLHAEIDELGSQLATLVDAIAPWLVDLAGVGPVTAAQVLVSWSHAGRLRSQAAFAAWPGPVRSRPRPGRSAATGPDRSGDRQLNRALHTIVIARLRDDPDTRAYAARCTAQGKTPREIRRCLKRLTARQLFKLSNATTSPASRSYERLTRHSSFSP
jgi:transposase